MRYFDCDMKEIHKGDFVVSTETGEKELVIQGVNDYGKETLGLNATNPDYLKHHPYSVEQIYPFSAFPHIDVEDGIQLTTYKMVESN